MKKLRVIVVLFSALFLLSACAHMANTTANVSSAPVLDRIVKKGELVVGTAASMPPLNMTTKEGEVIGFEIDIAGYMAEEMGVSLKVEAMPFSELLPALESGKVDMVMSGMTITGKRNLNVAFVGPYFTTGKAFLTKIKTIAAAKEASEINSPKTTLAVLKGSTSQVFVEKAIPLAKVVLTSNYDEAVDMVLKDKVHAMVADYPICAVSVMRHPDEGLLSIFTQLTYEAIGVAVPAGDPLLVNWVENFLGNHEGSGALEALKASWLKSRYWLERLP
jgi:polar amino acid transport system substrate-binding protein